MNSFRLKIRIMQVIAKCKKEGYRFQRVAQKAHSSTSAQVKSQALTYRGKVEQPKKTRISLEVD